MLTVVVRALPKVTVEATVAVTTMVKGPLCPAKSPAYQVNVCAVVKVGAGSLLTNCSPEGTVAVIHTPLALAAP